jgi:hypothetical protein
MKSLVPGDNTSTVEVTNISAHGIWLLSHGREQFLAYDDFPWFREQTVAAIINVQETSVGHYHWPDIDVDLSDEIIEHPGRYPLIAKVDIT